MRSLLAGADSFGSAHAAIKEDCSSRMTSSTWRFHAAMVALVDRYWPGSSIEPVSCLSRCVGVPACECLRSGSHTEAAPRSGCGAVRENLTHLATRHDFHRKVYFPVPSYDDSRVMGWHMVQSITSLLDPTGFATSRPGTASFRFDDRRC